MTSAMLTVLLLQSSAPAANATEPMPVPAFYHADLLPAPDSCGFTTGGPASTEAVDINDSGVMLIHRSPCWAFVPSSFLSPSGSDLIPIPSPGDNPHFAAECLNAQGDVAGEAEIQNQLFSFFMAAGQKPVMVTPPPGAWELFFSA